MYTQKKIKTFIEKLLKYQIHSIVIIFVGFYKQTHHLSTIYNSLMSWQTKTEAL